MNNCARRRRHKWFVIIPPRYKSFAYLNKQSVPPHYSTRENRESLRSVDAGVDGGLDLVKLQLSLDENQRLTSANTELVDKCARLEEELADLLGLCLNAMLTCAVPADHSIAEQEEGDEEAAKFADLRERLETQHVVRKETFEKEIARLQEQLQVKNRLIVQMQQQSSNTVLSPASPHNQQSPPSFFDPLHRPLNLPSSHPVSPSSSITSGSEQVKSEMSRQLSEFEVMKRALMRDLQNRCEKVWCGGSCVLLFSVSREFCRVIVVLSFFAWFH